jgi:hypothetical protein
MGHRDGRCRVRCRGALVVANAINHDGWNPWAVAVSWAGIVALAPILVKLRGSAELSSRTLRPMAAEKAPTRATA